MSHDVLPGDARVVFEVIRGRRCIREFIDKEVPSEYLRVIVEAGLWAPSGSNLQPREFILVRDKNLLRAVKLVSPGLYGNPSALLIICYNKNTARKGGRLGETMALLDAALSAQNIMLMAYALGVGSCPVMSFNKMAVKEILDIPDYVEPVLMISLGYPKSWPKPPRRKSVEEVLHVDGYGRRAR